MRQLVDYDRLERLSAYEALCALYEVICLYVNFFQPSIRFVSKQREASRVKKKYDPAKTPYQRVLEAEPFSEQAKGNLRHQYATLNPMALLRQMQRLQEMLWKLAATESTAAETAQTAIASS